VTVSIGKQAFRHIYFESKAGITWHILNSEHRGVATKYLYKRDAIRSWFP